MATFFALFACSAIQAGLNVYFSGFTELSVVQKGALYTVSTVMLWAGIATLLILIQHWQIEQNFGKPLEKLCDAIQRVANGDFSIRLSSDSKPHKQDHIDATYSNFNMMVKELSSIESIGSSFIADISHELKTPLAIIKSYGDAIQDSALDNEKRLEYAKDMVGAASTLANLVTNILRLNRLENQGLLPTPKRFDLCRQLSDCVLALSDRIEGKSIHFEAVIEEACYIVSDEMMLSIVWQNLLANAIKFTHSDGSISIKQTREEGCIVVLIEDTGRGMSEETMRHIFDKFYQGDTSHSEEGNGLGLALCWRIMNMVGGEIQVKSELGIGSSFKIILPSTT